MVLKIVLSALIWTVVFCQAPKPCCTDHQFEMSIGETFGSFYNEHGLPSSSVLIGGNKLHFDEYRRKAVIESRMVHLDGRREEINIFVDFNINKQFVQFPNGTCKEMQAIQVLRSPCMPMNATHLGSTYFGFGANKVEVDYFQVLYMNSDMKTRIGVTKYGCIPLVETITGHLVPRPDGSKAKVDLVFFMTNFQPGLSKPAIFDSFPTNCEIMSSDEAIPERTQRALTAFNLLFTE